MNVEEQNPPRALVKVGTLLGGKYKVERVIAEGGMGIVVRALNIDLKTHVAVKVLHPDLRYDESAFARFLQEARSVAKLKSEHIVQMIDVSSADVPVPFMVMELLDGVDLDTMVQLQGKIAPAAAVELIREACVGVTFAHDAGILHRDLKPANLFLAKKSAGGAVIKVLDFGLMKIKPEHGEDLKLTRPRDVFGTPSYMSPEQINAAVLDERSDVWSIGAILYELVTGRSAFGAETIAQTLVNISIHQPPPMDTFADNVPEGLQAVVNKSLAKDREDRYASVRALSDALATFVKASEKIDRAAFMPDRPVSIAPPPPKPSFAELAEKQAIPILTFPRNAPPQSSSAHELADEMVASERAEKRAAPRDKPSNALLLAIIAGAALGGVLALLFIRQGSPDSHVDDAPSSLSTNAATASTAPPAIVPSGTPVSALPLVVASAPPLQGSAGAPPQPNNLGIPKPPQNGAPMLPQNFVMPSATAPSASSAAPSVVAPVTNVAPVVNVAPDPRPQPPAPPTPSAAPAPSGYGEFGRRK